MGSVPVSEEVARGDGSPFDRAPARALSLYARHPSEAERVRRLLPADQQLIATDDWSRFEQAADRADCSIVFLDWLHCDDSIRGIWRFRTRFPFQPIVLITRRDANNLRNLRRTDVGDVVWIEDINHELMPVVRAAQTRTVLERIADTFDRAARLPPSIRHPLAFACRSDPAVRSVTELAQAAGCDRRTLWRRWRNAVPSGLDVRLEDVLHWLLLIRAVGRKTQTRSWADVSAELGVHEHTLARLSRRLAAARLRDLTDFSEHALVGRFARDVLHPVLGEMKWDRLA